MRTGSSSRTTIGLLARGAIAAMLVVGAAPWDCWNVTLQAQSDTIVLTPTVGTIPPVNVVTVNNGPGQQVRSTRQRRPGVVQRQVAPASIGYFRFSTGVDTLIPTDGSFADVLSDVSGTRITLSRVLLDRNAVFLFDTSTLTSTEIMPAAGSNRIGTAIGGNTVAFVDYGLGSGLGEIVAYDIARNLSQRLSFSDYSDDWPSVASNGAALVWQNCPTLVSNCDVMAAIRDATTGVWSATVVASAFHPEVGRGPDTDGTWITYAADRTGSATGRDIYFKPLTGGPERQLALPGRQESQRISKGVISFTGADASDTTDDLFVYVIATNTLYRITSTNDLGESLSDVDVLADGDIRVVWTVNDGPGGESNVYATTVRLPLTTTYGTCLLYDGDLVKKRGSAFPVKLQVCDGNGNNLSSPSIALHARSVTQVSTNVDGQVDTTGTANPDADFRYDAALAGYIFNLSTKGLLTGTYTLNFTVGADATVYSVPFAIK